MDDLTGGEHSANVNGAYLHSRNPASRRPRSYKYPELTTLVKKWPKEGSRLRELAHCLPLAAVCIVATLICMK